MCGEISGKHPTDYAKQGAERNRKGDTTSSADGLLSKISAKWSEFEIIRKAVNSLGKGRREDEERTIMLQLQTNPSIMIGY